MAEISEAQQNRRRVCEGNKEEASAKLPQSPLEEYIRVLKARDVEPLRGRIVAFFSSRSDSLQFGTLLVSIIEIDREAHRHIVIASGTDRRSSFKESHLEKGDLLLLVRSATDKESEEHLKALAMINR